MYCPKCGAECAIGARICPNCSCQLPTPDYQTAVACLIDAEGTAILQDAPRFWSSLIDICDGDDPLLCALERNCDEEFLSPFNEALAEGQPDSIHTASLRAQHILHNNRGISESKAEGICMGIARPLGDTTPASTPAVEVRPSYERPNESERSDTPEHPNAYDYPTAYDYPSDHGLSNEGGQDEITRQIPAIRYADRDVSVNTNGPGANSQYYSSNATSDSDNKPRPAMSPVLYFAILLLVGIGAFGACYLILNLTHQTGRETPVSEDGTTNGEVSSQGEVQSVPSEEPTKEAAGNTTSDNTTVRSSLADYSWEEIKGISSMMQQSGSRDQAMKIAMQYNLVSPDGTFPEGATKTIALNDGSTIAARLVDVMHDQTSDSQYAGMTFLATNVSHHRNMAGGRTTDGGWQASELRKWMNGTLYEQMPSDVRQVVSPVGKLSNNVGRTRSDKCITATSDMLWSPSIVEICGEVNWTFDSDPSNSSYYNWVFNQEGSQYAFYAQRSIRIEDPNACLALGEDWWLRSTAASTGRGRHVSSNGDPSTYGNSNDTLGVVVGFCV